MKNLFLGLLMTVGASGFAGQLSAKTIENKINTKNSQFEELNFNDETLSCTTTYVMRWYDCDGSFNDTKVATVEGECGEKEEGSLNFEVFRIDGCPTGGY